MFDVETAPGCILLYSRDRMQPEAVAAIRSTPGAKFLKARAPHWRLPESAAPAVLAMIEVGQARAEVATRRRLDAMAARKSINLEASAATSAEIEISRLGGSLMPFQRAAVAWCLENRRTIIGDEMGLGKTVQALAFLAASGDLPALVVCPAPLKINWQREAEKWLPGTRCAILQGSAAAPLPPADLLIVNWEILAARADQLARAGLRTLIVDEAHRGRNRKAARTKALRKLARSFGNRLLLTGTPIVGGPGDLIALLQTLGRFEELGGWERFSADYMIRDEWGWTNRGKNLDRLAVKLRESGLLLRRLKSDVLTELPPKRRVDLPLAVDLAAYNHELSAIKRAIADAGRIGGDQQAIALAGISRLRLESARAKLQPALDWMSNLSSPFLVFVERLEMGREVARELGAPFICGEVPLDERQRAVDAFQAGRGRALVLQLQAGGVGLTLTRATDVVFLESAWTPADNEQAEDRAHRHGQRDSVTAWYLWADGTIDDRVRELLAEKRQTADVVTGDSMKRALALTLVTNAANVEP